LNSFISEALILFLLQGWVDNFNAATGVVAGVGAGMITQIYGQEKLKADIVPVDLCANAIIALGWSTAMER
jgi:fatty acyl-CoA reductase